MKLSFNAANSNILKNDIIKLIEDGELKTWEIFTQSNIKYLRHIGQWGDKGVIELTPNNNNTILVAKVLGFKDATIEDFEGYYYGRFCELIFVKFQDRYTSIGK